MKLSTADPKGKPKKYLIITSSGGGGHTNAAEARKAELLALKIPENEIEMIDLMGVWDKAANKGKPWVPVYSIGGLSPFFSGAENTEKWNALQKAGTEEAVRMLESLVDMQVLAEAMQGSDVQKSLAEYLKNNDVQEIYNTQALSTPAICQAVVEHNATTEGQKHKLNILTTVTDLITHRADHFLGSLGKLTEEQKKVLTMEIAAAPLCDPYEKESDFNARYGTTGLFKPKSPLHIGYDGRITREENKDKTNYPSPVKEDYTNEPTDDNKEKIVIKVTDEQNRVTKIKANLAKLDQAKPGNQDQIEKQRKALADAEKAAKDVELNEGNQVAYINRILDEKATKDTDNIDEHITIKKKPNDKLVTITMGSQGSASVIHYMDAFAQQLKELENQPGNGNIYLCIATGKAGKGSLHEKAIAHAAKIMEGIENQELKKRVKILPLAFQDANNMASLLNYSDVLITRSGGMSSMEAEATNGRNPNRQVYVHSEAKLKYPNNFPKHSYDATYEALMLGTVKWEGGNAEYLLRNIGASLGSPETVDFGLNSTGKPKDVKENSLFHFAYDKRMNKDNLPKIEQLIREGSNPNMRFAGGKFLIDCCKDIETKILLARYGAVITKDCLAEVTPDEKKSLEAAALEYTKNGAPLKPVIEGDYKRKYNTNDTKNPFDKSREELAYSYLHPFEPHSFLEHVIIGMDKTGDFIKSKILRMDDIHDGLDSLRMHMQTDPTAKRNWLDRFRQIRNFSFNATVFIAKQPVNMVLKPLALASNIVKAGLMGIEMLRNLAKGEESNICNYDQLKAVTKQGAKNLGESLIAWGTAALVVSGFGAPITLGIFGASASISLGGASFGAAAPAAAGLNSAMTTAITMSQAPAINAVMMTEGVAEWMVARPLLYVALDPKKFFHEETSTSKAPKLNNLGETVKKLHETAQDRSQDIKARRAANAEIAKLKKLQTIHKVYAPALKHGAKMFKEEKQH